MNPDVRSDVMSSMGAPAQPGAPGNIPPELQKIYDEYVQKAQAAGEPVMPIEEFMQKAQEAAAQQGGGMPPPGGAPMPPQGGAPMPPQGGMPPM